MTNENLKLYIVLNANGALWERYQAQDAEWVREYIREHLPPKQARFLDKRLQVRGLPSRSLPADMKKRLRDMPPKQLVVALTADDRVRDTIREVLSFIRSGKPGGVFGGAGADLPFAGAEHWCPGQASGSVFSDRSAAEQLLGVPYVKDQIRLRRTGARGSHVNVVIVDQGLDSIRLGNAYADGWQVGDSIPGAPENGPENRHGGHGMLVARNILSIAPDAKLFDLPMLPARIGKVQDFFLNRADAAYRAMLDGIRRFKDREIFPGPWVVVNAWAIFDRRSEWPAGDYTNNPAHAFHALIEEAASAGIDVVFAAGNCGQYCPSERCGPRDRGPGNSILGANSYSSVLTVGAVRADTMWLGYSSQGPGQSMLETAKPDLCAPSQFREDQDAYTINTGTSTSAALAAGVVAALRSNWDSSQVSPQELRDILNRTARPAGGTGSDNRLGSGVLDAARAYDELKSKFP
jgi:hypothetical protein